MRQAGLIVAALALATGSLFAQAAPAKPAASAARPVAAGPVIVVETVKGTFEIETYPTEAPKTVEHVLALVRRNFYNGQRVHRVAPGFVVQFGDPQTRDMTKQDRWGTGGSGKSIGGGEFSKKRTHILGAVAMAAPGGDAKLGDSQMYIMLAPAHRLDGSYTVFGHVISGMSVVQKLAVKDVIRKVTVKVEAPAVKK